MRKLFFSSWLLMSFISLQAQDGPEFMHSLGGKFFFYPNSDGFTSTAIVYSPRVNVIYGENSSLSIGTHLGLGFSLTNRAQGGSRSFVLDLPLVVEWNLGTGSTRDYTDGFGGYVGAGYGLHRVSISSDEWGGNSAATLHGPVFTGGFRFSAGMAGVFELGGSYLIDLKSKEQKINPVGISLSYFLGL